MLDDVRRRLIECFLQRPLADEYGRWRCVYKLGCVIARRRWLAVALRRISAPAFATFPDPAPAEYYYRFIPAYQRRVSDCRDAPTIFFRDQLPLYSIVYSNGPLRGATFSIESARKGIGDRNIMVEEDTEETEIQSPLGPMYLIYRPKGKTGRKIQIISNWVSDANMNAEKAKGTDNHPILGRFHGFSATGIMVAEFGKIVQSLHPIRSEAATPAAAQTSAPKIHPKVFRMITCWVSDSESPVVTEINLDAVEKNRNEFNQDGMR